ncbi:hypothetical protein EJB05_12067, partial [Eragrostis curvula]
MDQATSLLVGAGRHRRRVGLAPARHGDCGELECHIILLLGCPEQALWSNSDEGHEGKQAVGEDTLDEVVIPLLKQVDNFETSIGRMETYLGKHELSKLVSKSPFLLSVGSIDLQFIYRLSSCGVVLLTKWV